MKTNDINSTTSWYDNIYDKHKAGEKECAVSVNNISKARSLVKRVWRTFDLCPMRSETSVLDLGCGLGFVSEALRETGGKVLGIDMSNVAIECAKASFPLVEFDCTSFDEVVHGQRKFDVIWALDFSVINTDDMEIIGNNFIQPCLNILKDEGVLIVGWHTNFTGEKLAGSFVQWDKAAIRKLKEDFGLSDPRVVKFKSTLLNWAILHGCQLIGKIGISSIAKPIPIYLIRRKLSSD